MLIDLLKRESPSMYQKILGKRKIKIYQLEYKLNVLRAYWKTSKDDLKNRERIEREAKEIKEEIDYLKQE